MLFAQQTQFVFVGNAKLDEVPRSDKRGCCRSLVSSPKRNTEEPCLIPKHTLFVGPPGWITRANATHVWRRHLDAARVGVFAPFVGSAGDEQGSFCVDAAVTHFVIPCTEGLSCGRQVDISRTVNLVGCFGNDPSHIHVSQRRINADYQTRKSCHVWCCRRRAIKTHVVIGWRVSRSSEAVRSRYLETGRDHVHVWTEAGAPKRLDRRVADSFANVISV